MITFAEYANTAHYKEKITKTLEAARAKMSPASYEVFSRPLLQELVRIDAELESYRSALSKRDLNEKAAASLAKLVINTIDRHVSMLVKSNVNVFLNTPVRAVPYAVPELAKTRLIVNSPISDHCDLMCALA